MDYVQDYPGEPAPGRWNQEGKTNLDLLEQEIMSGSGISYAICKSASWPWQMSVNILSWFIVHFPGEYYMASPLVLEYWKLLVLKLFIMARYLSECNCGITISYCSSMYLLSDSKGTRHTHTTILQRSWILRGITRMSLHQKGKTRKVNPICIY